MGKKIKYIGNWNDKRCKFDQSVDGGARGTYTNGISFAKFSLNKQTNGEYLLRGRLSLRSVRNEAKVLERIEEDGKKVPIAADIRLKSIEEEDIKAEIVMRFESLVANNYDIIYKDVKGTRADDLTLLQALHVFGREYIIDAKKVKREVFAEVNTTRDDNTAAKEAKGSEPMSKEVEDKNTKKDDPVKKKIDQLNKVAVKLEKYSLCEIPQSALTKIKQETGKSTDGAFRDLCEFVAYLQRRHRYFGENPFLVFYEKNPKKTPKSAEELTDALDKPESLEKDVQQKVYERISLAPSDAEKETGVLLVYGAGLTAVDACKQKWGSLVFGQVPYFPESCQIKLWREQTTGSTHDFTRPLFPFVARELKRRYLELKEQDPELDEKKIVGNLNSSQLTAYCRTLLLHCGVKYSDVVDARTKGTGGGVMLMRKDYHYRLMYECGITKVAELNYLRMYSMGCDVTVDNYRSLSSPSGQYRLQVALNRYTAHESMPKDTKITEEKNAETGLNHITVPPSNPERTTAIITRVKLKSGEIFRFYSPEGLDGTVTVVTEKDEY